MIALSARTLVATFGFDERRVLPALRLLAYDSLVLVTGREATRTPGYARLKDLEPGMRTVTLDPFDLLACVGTIARVFEEVRESGSVPRVSLSGGTKILSAAALLAAFQEGVEAWYCDADGEPVRLPVLRGIRFSELVGGAALDLAHDLRRPVPAEQLFAGAALRGVHYREAQSALNRLLVQGFAEEVLDRGTVIVRPTAALEAVRAHLVPPQQRPKRDGPMPRRVPRDPRPSGSASQERRHGS